jgi:hypothetical protein
MKIRLALLLLGLASAGCEPPPEKLEAMLPAMVSEASARDYELETCRDRVAEAKARPALPGAAAFEAARPALLGRAVGEPVIFVREPAEAVTLKPGENGGRRVLNLVLSHPHDKKKLRASLLREGYVYSADPDEAFALSQHASLPDLFDEERIWLLRADRVLELVKAPARYDRGHEYRFADGDQAGRTATLLFADQLALDPKELGAPLHRDVRGLRRRAGFDRFKVVHLGERAIVAELRYGAQKVEALIESDGAHLEIGCIQAPAPVRAEVAAYAEANASRRRSIAALSRTVTDIVAERLPFDRPRDAEDHKEDGQLRPQWEWAYARGYHGLSHDGEGYGVFDADGRPAPPETCVAMVLDSYERAGGTWYRPAGEKRERVIGALDFNSYGVFNRAGVIGFAKFAETKPELFTVSWVPYAERIEFRERERFFADLVARADEFDPGDIVAIQGLKRDGVIHQHAILVEDTDPITGMPFALADQMKRPRRRSWEGIMAEAPLRALYYHIKPTPALLAKLDRQPPAPMLANQMANAAQ